MPETWNVFQGKLQATNGAVTRFGSLDPGARKFCLVGERIQEWTERRLSRIRVINAKESKGRAKVHSLLE
jgi:hypothetical protein